MSKTVRFYIEGAYARVEGIPRTVLNSYVRFYAPKYQYARKYKEGIWDGTITLARGKHIPTGLIGHVKKQLKREKKRVKIHDPYKNDDIDLSDFSNDILKGIVLDDHQMEGAIALLERMRGVVQAPTGSGKTYVIAAVALFLHQQADLRTTIIVPRKGLVNQTVESLRETFGSDGPSIGMLGGGVKQAGAVTVATAQTLLGFRGYTRKGKRTKVNQVAKDVIENTDCLVADECHSASSDSWLEIAMSCPATRRYGLSATPLKHKELPDAKLKGATGPLVKVVEPQRIIDKGFVTQPKICMLMSDRASHKPLYSVGVRRDGKEYAKKDEYQKVYKKGIVESVTHNNTVIDCARWLIAQGRRTLVLCRQRKQHRILETIAEDKGMSFLAVHGDDPVSAREYAKNAIYENEVSCLIATTIFDMGEDVKGLEGLVIAESVKDHNLAVQRIGRGMRMFEGSDGELWVVDLISTCDPRFIEHGASRIDAYEEKGYPVEVVEKWPKKRDPASVEDLFPFREIESGQ